MVKVLKVANVLICDIVSQIFQELIEVFAYNSSSQLSAEVKEVKGFILNGLFNEKKNVLELNKRSFIVLLYDITFYNVP